MDAPDFQVEICHGWLPRRCWLPAFLILGLAAGCNHFKSAAPTPEIPKKAGTIMPTDDPVASGKKDKEPKHQPPVSLLVSTANIRVDTAFKEGLPLASKQQMIEEARISYQQALRNDPKCAAAYTGLANLYDQVEDHDKAVATYQSALKALPKCASLWYQLGMSQARHREWDAAIASMRNARDLDAENRAYRFGLGYCMARAGNIDDSYSYFESEVGEAKAHFQIARMLHHMQRVDECRDHLHKALQANPELGEAKEMLSELDQPADAPRPLLQVSFDAEVLPGVQK